VDYISANEEIDGFELLTMDDMWNQIKRICVSRVTLHHTTDGDMVEWVHSGKSRIQKNVSMFNPETLIQIFDVETKGNVIDS
jgi:hypothetical protein